MAHTLKLGFKDDPTIGTDDAIDLGNADPTASGYGLLDYQIGDVYLDQYNHEVRDITLQEEINGGGTNDVLISRLRALNRYIDRTREFLGHYQGNYPACSDMSWHSGRAAVLTFKASAASNKVYWNVLDGKVQLNQPLLGSELVNNILRVTVTLTVEAAARGTKVTLKNMLPMGDFAPPFTTSSTFPSLTSGYVFTNIWSVAAGLAGATLTPYVNQFLYSSGNAATATSPEVTDITTGDILVPSIKVYVPTYASGTLTAVFQVYNGVSYSTQQTLGTFTGPVMTGDNWVTWTGTAYTVAAGITKVKIVLTCPANTTHQTRTLGWAIWKNPVGNTAPTEFLAAGSKTGVPTVNIYGVQGDVPTPPIIHIDNPAANTEQIFFIGQQVMDCYQDDPVFELDLKLTGSTTASTSLYWDVLPATNSGVATTSTYSASYTHLADNINSTGRVVDRLPRLYRAFLMYAANDSAAITQVELDMGLLDTTRIYNISLPQTYTGTANAAAGDFRLFDLGDFYFPRPGVAWAERTASEATATRIILTHSNSANRRTSVGGVILVPVHDRSIGVVFASGGLGQNKRLNLYCHASAPRVSMEDTTTPTVTPWDIQTYDTGSLVTGSNLMLSPAVTISKLQGPILNRLCLLMLRTRSASNDRLYTFNAQDTNLVWVEYTPRYLYGFM